MTPAETVKLLQDITLPIAAMIACVVLYRDSQTRIHDSIDANAKAIQELLVSVNALRELLQTTIENIHKP